MSDFPFAPGFLTGLINYHDSLDEEAEKMLSNCWLHLRQWVKENKPLPSRTFNL